MTTPNSVRTVRGILIDFAKKQYPDHVIHLIERDIVDQAISEILELLDTLTKHNVHFTDNTTHQLIDLAEVKRLFKED